MGECRPVEYKPRQKTSCCWMRLEERLRRSSSKQVGLPAELSMLGMQSDRHYL